MTMMDEIFVVSPQGRLDSVTSGTFEHDLLKSIDAGATKLLIDYSNLDSIASAGLRSVLIAAKRVAACGGRMSL